MGIGGIAFIMLTNKPVLDIACFYSTVSFLVQSKCLLDSKYSIIFHLSHIRPFFTHTAASIVKLKVHQSFVLCTGCVREIVAINQKLKHQKWYSPKKKRRNCLTYYLSGLTLGGVIHWIGH